ncbi:hypothetical protein HDU99_005091, partial [Rhizoclosmatium hyalinum]
EKLRNAVRVAPYKIRVSRINTESTTQIGNVALSLRPNHSFNQTRQMPALVSIPAVVRPTADSLKAAKVATIDHHAAAASAQVKAEAESLICDVCSHSSIPHMKHPELL